MSKFSEEYIKEVLSFHHQSTAAVFKHFKYAHLPPHIQPISIMFHDLAVEAMAFIPAGGAELMVGLRKLLEAKDCCVRAAVNP